MTILRKVHKYWGNASILWEAPLPPLEEEWGQVPVALEAPGHPPSGKGDAMLDGGGFPVTSDQAVGSSAATASSSMFPSWWQVGSWAGVARRQGRCREKQAKPGFHSTQAWTLLHTTLHEAKASPPTCLQGGFLKGRGGPVSLTFRKERPVDLAARGKPSYLPWLLWVIKFQNSFASQSSKFINRKQGGECPGSPVARTPGFYCQGPRFNPCLAN